MIKSLKNITRTFISRFIKRVVTFVYGKNSNIYKVLENQFISEKRFFINSKEGSDVKLFAPFRIVNSEIKEYTYIAQNAIINNTIIGKFCSIGPNLLCGWGIHPTHGVSTHPMFYSTLKQNGMTLSAKDKIQETKQIIIGNDVFVGMNVTILDGITIGDGAFIGAGAVVSKDIPPYAIAVGNPIRILKYRFEPEIIEKLQVLQWWNRNIEDLSLVEKHFFDVERLIVEFERQIKA